MVPFGDITPINPMFLARLKAGWHEFLSNQLAVGIITLGFFGIGSTFGWKAFVALRHGLHLNDVVTWYGRGNGNMYQYYLSTLIIYSACWLLGGLGLLLTAWMHNRFRSNLKQSIRR